MICYSSSARKHPYIHPNLPGHRDDLEIPYAQPDKESPVTPGLPYRPDRLPPTDPGPTLGTPHLHPPSYDLEWITRCLTDRPCHRTATKIPRRRRREVRGGVTFQRPVSEKRNAGVGDHAEDGDGEASVERVERDGAGEGGYTGFAGRGPGDVGFVVDGPYGLAERGSFRVLGLEGEADADELEGVG